MNGGWTMWHAMKFNRISWYFTPSNCHFFLVKIELKCHSSHCLTHPHMFSILLFLLSDTAGFVQFISHCSRDFPPGRTLLPHTLLLLSPWWPERGIGGWGGGWRWQHRSRLQREEGAGHLLCHVGGGGSCHTVLVRRRIQTSLSPTKCLKFMATETNVLVLASLNKNTSATVEQYI